MSVMREVGGSPKPSKGEEEVDGRCGLQERDDVENNTYDQQTNYTQCNSDIKHSSENK